MKSILALIVFFLLLYCATTLLAADPAPQCLPEKIEVEKLKQDVFRLQQQLMQAQFPAVQQAEKAAQAEQARLEALRPKPENPKKESTQQKP